jgi:hypothetical protein
MHAVLPVLVFIGLGTIQTWLTLCCHAASGIAAFLRVEKWEGVSWQQDRVAELFLLGRGLTGPLSGIGTILEQLPGLLVLGLGYNSISGPLTQFLGPSLRTLDLSYNQLTGVKLGDIP